MNQGTKERLKFGSIVLISGLAGMAALLSPIGNAIIDQFGYSGAAAAHVWMGIAAFAVITGGILAFLDWNSRGRY